MTISISTIPDEAAFNNYLAARNAPRDTIRYGVRPNCVKALAEYSALLNALQGDMSAFATYHANATATVTPFVALMQKCMEVLVMTPALINQAAVAQGIAPPFGAEINEPVDLTDYKALLLATVQAIQSVSAAAQAMQEAE
jgi:hypothetical protein